MSKPLLIEIEYDKTMSFTFVNPTYTKAVPSTFDDPGWSERLEYESVYLTGDPNQNDLTNLFDENSLKYLEDKLKDQMRPTGP